MSLIRKAVIPAAGYGTGFLPAAKAQPKELLPIVDKPIIQFIVEEALASGIEEIMIITGRHKRAIEDHFDSNPELEDNLASKHKDELLELVRSTTKANLFFVRQAYPAGLADAVKHARAFVYNEPFVVMLGDNIIETASNPPATKQLLDVYDKYQVSVVAAIESPTSTLNQYGIIDPDKQVLDEADLLTVNQFIEKPEIDQAPSNLTIAGRYVLRPEIFDVIDYLKPGVEGELQLTDAINILNQFQRVIAKKIKGTRYDVGNKLGYLDFSLRYGLVHPETKDELAEYIKKLATDL